MARRESTFGWILDDFRRLGEALQQRGTWLFIAMASVFSGIIYLTFRYALRMDFILRLHHIADSNCRDLDNTTMLIMFCASFFFGLAVIVALGELARHAEFRRHHAYREGRVAGWMCLGWGLIALLVGGSMLMVLGSHC